MNIEKPLRYRLCAFVKPRKLDRTAGVFPLASVRCTKDRPEEAARAKAAGGTPTAFRCVEVNCVERSRACLAMGRRASMRRECVASVSGPTTPDSADAVTSDDADQASVAVLPRHVDRKLAASGRRPARSFPVYRLAIPVGFENLARGVNDEHAFVGIRLVARPILRGPEPGEGRDDAVITAHGEGKPIDGAKGSWRSPTASRLCRTAAFTSRRSTVREIGGGTVTVPVWDTLQRYHPVTLGH
jgi:hypothetical protein